MEEDEEKRVKLRLFVELSETVDFKSAVKRIQSFSYEVKQHKFSFDSEDTTIHHPALYGWETNRIVEYGDEFAKYAIMDVQINEQVQKYLYYLFVVAYEKRENKELHFPVGVTIEYDNHFYKPLSTDHSRIKLENAAFGNLLGNNFFNHFCIPHGGEIPESLEEKSNITVSVEYDRNQIVINCCGPHKREQKPARNGNRRSIGGPLDAYSITVIITPTRVLFMIPEMIKGNRVLRKYGAKDIFRASFREDSGELIRDSKVIQFKIKYHMTNGIFLQERKYSYLGSSTSQMREGGAYFHVSSILEDYVADADGMVSILKPYSVERIHRELGNFEKLNYIEKYMARLGQCFTQSQAVNHKLEPRFLLFVSEVIGGANNKSPYMFSDGCGFISMSLARSLAKEFGLDEDSGIQVPSTFQFRLGGYKGVLSVNPLMDQYNSILANSYTNGYVPDEYHVALRQSQDKFISDDQHKARLEIVKFSGVTAVSLNKPLINILDQESAHQSSECHKRIIKRIEDLLEDHLLRLARMLIDDKAFLTTLKGLPKRIDVSELNDLNFDLMNESFFRSMVKSVVIYGIVKQLKKMQIEIPPSLGRSMFGIIDETGLLQSGQVFVQYTNDTSEYSPRSSARKITVTGNVLVTKSPSVVCGDVRVFDAVDVPELRHLVDVIVFPQHGPRPHSDEMAGSDLDGDEYSIIWDPELLLEKNAPAAHYGKSSAETKKIAFEDLNTEMCNFFVNYLSGDSVGTISNAHLFQSDLRGINSPVCRGIAKKVNEAVDFPKSGIAPKSLTMIWGGDRLPPEKLDMNPDYHTNSSHLPSYKSHRLIGRMYRYLQEIEERVSLSIHATGAHSVQIDKSLLYTGWELYEQQAKDEMIEYNHCIASLMSAYGIKSEGEIFSGYLTELSRGYNTCENNTMFSTERAVGDRLTQIVREYRQRFFGDDWMTKTEPRDDRCVDEYQTDILKRRIRSSEPDLLKKASAYYHVCYDSASKSKQSSGELLSFPWIVADVLAEVRKDNIFRNSSEVLDSKSHFSETIQKQVNFYFNRSKTDRFRFLLNVEKIDCLRYYFTTYPSLALIARFLCVWWNKVRETKAIREEHICLLLVRFAYSYSANSHTDPPYIDKYSLTNTNDQSSKKVLDSIKLLVKFMEYLASRSFKNKTSLCFLSDGYPSALRRNEWHELHKAALKTFYGLIFTMHFQEMPIAETSTKQPIEREPFVIHVPESVDLEILEKMALKKYRNLKVKFRRFDGKRLKKVSAVARAPLDTLRKLQTFLTPVPEKMKNYNNKALCDKLMESAPFLDEYARFAAEYKEAK